MLKTHEVYDPEQGWVNWCDPRLGISLEEWATFSRRDKLWHLCNKDLPIAEGGTRFGAYEILVADTADGTAVSATTTETITCPDYSFAANDATRLWKGAQYRIRQMYDVSNVVTTPGTIQFTLRWGG